MKFKHGLVVGLLVLMTTGCASYNQHIDQCHGGNASTVRKVFDYLPIGAVIDNTACAITGKDAVINGQK